MHRVSIPNLTNNIFYGNDFTSDISKIFSMTGIPGSKVVIYVGVNSFKRTEYPGLLKSILEYHAAEVVYEQSISPNPLREDIDRSIAVIDALDTPFIIAIGGGSVLDYAKACKLYSKKPYKLISLYTNLGSGSIVSPFTIYDNDEFKIGDYSEQIVPEIVYVNEDIVKSVPRAITVAGLCDIFSHALESSLSTAATVDSRQHAQKALNHIEKYLDTGSFKNMLFADIYAGLSERVGVVLAPHALGHFLTYSYDVPHGYASIVFMEAYLRHLEAAGLQIEPRLLQMTRYMYDLSRQHLVLPDDLPELLDEDVARIIKYMGFVIDNSPVKTGEKDLISIFNKSVHNVVNARGDMND